MLKTSRYPVIDCIRGGAIIAMMLYHFGFDLNMQGYIAQDINHNATWHVARSLILGTFLFVAGFSISLAANQYISRRLIRLVRISACAILVSISSYFMFPDSWIFFGVLHFVVVGSLICWLVMPHKKLLFTLGILLLALGLFYQSPVFNQPLLQWVGMMTYKPITEDYVPLLPWLGVMMIGVGIGQWTLTKKDILLFDDKPSTVLFPVQWLGRHSLIVYMLHQPIFLAALFIFGMVYK